MNIAIATPVGIGLRRGNRVTADRWARLFAELGHTVTLHDGDAALVEADVLIALHARKSHGVLTGFHRRFPDRPTVLVLTGTDLHRDRAGDAQVEESLEVAEHLVLLQEHGADRLTAAQEAKAIVIEQACAAPQAPVPLDPPADPDDLLLVGHLREVKDPFLAGRALALLPSPPPFRLLHMGAALGGSMEQEALELMGRMSHYLWLGDRPREEVLTRMATCRALLLTSRGEGGANVIAEALACEAPILAAANDGTRGQLGDDHPGLFPVGDAGALAVLLQRLAEEPVFGASLLRASRSLKPRIDPDRERAAWGRLLAGLQAR